MALFKVVEIFILLTELCERVCVRVCVSPADQEYLSLRRRHPSVENVDLSVAHPSLLHIFLAAGGLDGSFECSVHKIKMMCIFFFFRADDERPDPSDRSTLSATFHTFLPLGLFFGRVSFGLNLRLCAGTTMKISGDQTTSWNDKLQMSRCQGEKSKKTSCQIRQSKLANR